MVLDLHIGKDGLIHNFYEKEHLLIPEDFALKLKLKDQGLTQLIRYAKKKQTTQVTSEDQDEALFQLGDHQDSSKTVPSTKSLVV